MTASHALARWVPRTLAILSLAGPLVAADPAAGGDAPGWKPGWGGVVEIHPGGTLWSPGLRGTRLDGGKYPVDVLFSSIPSVKLGLEFETPHVVYRGTLGAGLLFNLEFLSPFGLAEVSTLFEIDEGATIGPQVGVLYFGEPTWYGHVETRFSDAWGANTAVQFTYGIPEASLLLTAGYIWASFDAESDRMPATDGRLDLSGPYAQIGVVLRF